ncbi:MAG: hypothetical protein PHN61_04680 [Methanothrix sp.]|nr:hypothetical protein [Methanothrix sp.]
MFILLACSSFAASLQLSGDSGRAILSTINLTNNTNATDETDLWSWGKLPVGHFINASGKLSAHPLNDEGLVVVPPRSDASS